MPDGEPEQPGWAMVMPFLPVVSNGGPYEDDAYVAGFEMGRLDAVLAPRTLDRYETTVHTHNQEQTDLIAMKHGYVLELVTGGDGWVEIVLTRTTPLGEPTGG